SLVTGKKSVWPRCGQKDEQMETTNETWRTPAMALCLGSLFMMNAYAQSFRTPGEGRAQEQKKSYTPASVHALDGLKCKIHPSCSDPSTVVTVFTDDDGYARFHAVRPAAGEAPQRFTLDCADAEGRPSSYAVDLAAEETYAPRKLDLANERGI